MTATRVSPVASATVNSRGGSGGSAPIATQGQRVKEARGRRATVSRSAKCKTTEGCKRCLANPRRVCVACAQRRRRAVELAEKDGLSAQEIAARMHLSVPRVERLFEEEAQIRDLQQYKCDSVPVETIQRLVEARQAEDASLTQERIALLAGYTSRIALLRALGLAPSARAVKKGREYPPEIRKNVDVGAAGRIVRAIGIAPYEVPDL
jgi:AraC-like DNA-binding protein